MGQPNSSPHGKITKTITTKTTYEEDSEPVAVRRPSVVTVTSADPHPSPATPLSSRTFGTWTFAVGILRVYAAYHLHEKDWYHLAMWANVIGLTHFGLEAFAFKTTQPRGPWFAPVGTATVGLAWMIAQYGYYVG